MPAELKHGCKKNLGGLSLFILFMITRVTDAKGTHT